MADIGEVKHDSPTLIREHIVPGLRARGFKGSFPHFRRITETGVQLLTFQLDKWGSGNFVAEIARAPLGPISVGWGDPIPSNKLTAHDVVVRMRLGATSAGSDYWFQHRSLASDPAKTSAMFLELVDTQGARWWGGA